MRHDGEAERSGQRWAMLALLCGAELLGMSVWFAASAVSPQLQGLWGLSPAEAGWLTGAVQLGFVTGTAIAALMNLPDVLPSRGYFAGCALLAAVANAALAVAPGFASAISMRFLTGLFLAGVYPPAMKMIATWFRSARGLALGALVGALTLGKATPYLVRAFEHADFRTVILTCSAGALAASALVMASYRDGPHPFPRRPFSWSLAGDVVRHRPTRLAIGGYLGHMWELYAMWTWIPAFIAASLVARQRALAASYAAWADEVVAFGAIAAGGLGCVWGGWAADRIGRERVVNLAMGASGLCCLLIGAAFGASLWILVPLAWVWGFFVVADSAQFSALVTEVAPTHSVGTALTLQTSLGFLLTIVTIELVPAVAEHSGWRWAFALLAAGPAAGIVSILRLARARAG